MWVVVKCTTLPWCRMKNQYDESSSWTNLGYQFDISKEKRIQICTYSSMVHVGWFAKLLLQVWTNLQFRPYVDDVLYIKNVCLEEFRRCKTACDDLIKTCNSPLRCSNVQNDCKTIAKRLQTDISLTDIHRHEIVIKSSNWVLQRWFTIEGSLSD